MNEEMIKQLIQYLDGTKDFIIQEAPDVIQQILTYKIYSNWAGFIIFSIIVITSVIVFIFGYRTPKDKYNEYTSKAVSLMTVSSFIFMIFLLFSIACMDELIKMTYAPKYYLIQLLLKGK